MELKQHWRSIIFFLKVWHFHAAGYEGFSDLFTHEEKCSDVEKPPHKGIKKLSVRQSLYLPKHGVKKQYSPPIDDSFDVFLFFSGYEKTEKNAAHASLSQPSILLQLSAFLYIIRT